MDIISSSLNDLSLRVLNGSRLPELDIFEVRKSIFLKVNQPAGSKKVLQAVQKISEAWVREESTTGAVLDQYVGAR